MFEPFRSAGVSHHRATPGPSPDVSHVLSQTHFDTAEREIRTWDGYAETPLISLTDLAEALDLGEVLYKHEGPRFGLGSFKALGGAYAVSRVLQREISRIEGREVPLDEIRDGKFAHHTAGITFISATDGNHGRSVAWGAGRFGAPCRIYIHAEVSAYREKVLGELGAEVIRVDGDYDETVEQTRKDAEEHGWLIVSDTSWPGYVEPPREVMAGYGLMAREVVRALPEAPTHVFLQGGVGGLAAAVAAVFAQEWGEAAPRVVIVEPELAPCLIASARANGLTAVKIEEETIMAGLSCGEPSELAWNVLSRLAGDYMTIPEAVVGPTVRMLARPSGAQPAIEAGESGVAGLCGMISAAVQAPLRDRLALDGDARVVLMGSEGVTDPHVFADLMAGAD
ncbi:MAG: diaminopropionate ammonia-lyase [Pseudomonadota bacterium]